MIWALSLLSCFGFIAISALALLCPRLCGWRYWPPERAATWQHSSFRALFRLGLYPLIAASVLLVRATGVWLPAPGIALMFAGFGGALWVTGKLGWKQAFGTAQGLVVTGPYAYSRNPVYVATWLALLGWGLCLPYLPVAIPLVLWGLLYYIAPFLEEPWLEEKFGAPYRAYKAKTPRFFGP
ncbi:methyltransferase family protein [Planktotalea arctica]|uniref:methyltransferase family protein n=1 Tax=Planktotalea arctica TaxID=1481893 RepID=UPI00111BFA6B|nr:isoprenylcysteine carboxylmethyltransferase family protein [Planktotalea arctica]